MSELLTFDSLIAFLTLTGLEIVLGIDNIVLIAILCGKLEPALQNKARRLGLILAMGMRIAMLGELDVVKGILKALPEQIKSAGAHGLSLLYHARVGGERSAAVLDHLQSLGAPDNGSPVQAKEVADALAGDYASIDSGVRFQVAPAKQGLTVRANQGIPRILYQLADGSFHPAGAPSVRIRFEPKGVQAKTLMLAVGGKTFEAARAS